MTEAKQTNAVLQRHTGIIIDWCCSLLGSAEALILYGGYGRGEGSWVRHEDGWRPYNDYDLVAVVKHKVAYEKVKQLRKDLAQELGIQWVDISQKTRRKLARLKPSIYNYDLKYASTVIYGDPAILDVIPTMDAARLPLKEALTLFLTRLWTFLGSLDEQGLGQALEGEAAMFFRNQMAKALLAAVDVELLLKGAYHPSYQMRVERLGRDDALPEETRDLFRWALTEKLRPRGPAMTAEEVTHLYDQVHGIFLAFMLKALSRYFGKALSTVEEIATAYLWHWDTVFMRVIYPFAKRSLRFERVVKVNLVQMYIFGAYRPEQDVDGPLLTRTCSLLRKLDPDLSKDMTWDQARLAAAELRNTV